MSGSRLLIDPKAAEQEIVDFIRQMVAGAEAEGVVVGLSGGVDSSVVATLCARALGPERVLGLIMPARFTPRKDVADAKELAEKLGVKVEIVDIDPIVGSFLQILPEADRVTIGNVRARVRMVILYYFANKLRYLVAGTGDRSEILLGYLTKYGDGAADFLPIAHLYKTQVRQLATHLGLPERVVTKPSAPWLWKGHKAVDELPADYETLDLILHALIDLRRPKEDIAKELQCGAELIEEVIRWIERGQHKRRLPPSLR